MEGKEGDMKSRKIILANKSSFKFYLTSSYLEKDAWRNPVKW